MGGGQSINQTTFQSAMTTVNQLISQQCVNVCYNQGTQIDVKITGGATVNNIKAGDSCLIKGASCSLKASLDNEIVNNLITKDKATQSKMVDPLTILSDLVSGGQKINQTEYQKIVNAVTQEINSVCGQTAGNSNSHYNIQISGEGTYVNDANFISEASINKSTCIMDNIVKSSVQNSETSDNTASQKEASILALLIIGFIIIAVVLIVVPIWAFEKTVTGLGKVLGNLTPGQIEAFGDVGTKAAMMA